MSENKRTLQQRQTLDKLMAFIEIVPEITGVKYEYDKDKSCLAVDRFMTSSMHYPLPYGFVPETLSRDGDPLDVLVITPHPLMPGVLIEVTPIAALQMEDEAGRDEKILAVPVAALCAGSMPQSLAEVDTTLLNSIEHFFTHYKDHELNKWVKVGGWIDKEPAKSLVKEAVDAY